MSATVPWTCPTCNTAVATASCPACGEHPLRTRDLTLRGLVEHLFESFTSIDSKLVRSFRNLLLHPGTLTVAYLEGRRKAFLGPVPLFLISNVVFFAVESLVGSKVFITPLDSHLHTQPWSPFAPWLVNHRLASLHTTLELYAPAFDQAIALKARSLIIFMALFFSLVPLLVFLRRRRPLVAHAVFSLHFYAFLLLPMCVAAFIEAVEGWVGGFGFTHEVLDRLPFDRAAGGRARCICYLAIGNGLRHAWLRAYHRDPGAHGLRGRDRAGLPLRAAADHALQHRELRQVLRDRQPAHALAGRGEDRIATAGAIGGVPGSPAPPMRLAASSRWPPGPPAPR